MSNPVKGNKLQRIILVNGPNLNLLGEREPEIYGKMTLAELNAEVSDFAQAMNIDVKVFQSNSEGRLIDFIHSQRKWADGILINPAAFTHYSYAIRDAISGVALPTVEVHLSDVENREPFRKHSVLAEVVAKRFMGLGLTGYLHGIEFLAGLAVRKHLEDLTKNKISKDVLLLETVKILKERFPKYNWVGIYLTEGPELVLHNFLGKPTPHERIPVGQGICGAAVVEKKTILVSDVKSDPRYLACSVETRSEIVVPIFVGDKVVGEIDIDSDLADAFNVVDKEFLEACASVLGAHFFNQGP